MGRGVRSPPSVREGVGRGRGHGLAVLGRPVRGTLSSQPRPYSDTGLERREASEMQPRARCNAWRAALPPKPRLRDRRRHHNVSAYPQARLGLALIRVMSVAKAKPVKGYMMAAVRGDYVYLTSQPLGSSRTLLSD
jgi:hypothetical protein